jgi:hypothetical protein
MIKKKKKKKRKEKKRGRRVIVWSVNRIIYGRIMPLFYIGIYTLLRMNHPLDYRDFDPILQQ